MWSFVDFLVDEARKGEYAECLLFYGGAAAFVFCVFFLRFMFG